MNTTYTNRKNPITPKFKVSEIFYALGAKKLPESLKQQLMDCHRTGDWGDMNEYHVKYVNEPSLAKMDGHVSSQYMDRLQRPNLHRPYRRQHERASHHPRRQSLLKSPNPEPA